MTAALDLGSTVDAFLGAKVEAVQHGGGVHRSGLEAVLLASAIDDEFAGSLYDLGSGSGVAGMCVAARAGGARVALVDRDEQALAAARTALARPANRAFAERVSVIAADVSDTESGRVASGLGRSVADAVILNPPFHEAERGTHSPSAARAGAHVLGSAGLDPWIRTAASILKPDGRLVVIFSADGLAGLLSALDGRFGGTAVLAIHPRASSRAHRILVRAFKGSRARLSILPGFALHAATGSSYLPEADAILRDGRSLAGVHPAWSD